MRKAILLLIPTLAFACGEAPEEPRARVISVEDPKRDEYVQPKAVTEEEKEKFLKIQAELEKLTVQIQKEMEATILEDGLTAEKFGELHSIMMAPESKGYQEMKPEDKKKIIAALERLDKLQQSAPKRRKAVIESHGLTEERYIEIRMMGVN